MEGNEKQQPEIIDIDGIPSPERISVNSTPILEEIQQPQVEAMKEDTPSREMIIVVSKKETRGKRKVSKSRLTG